MDTCLKEGDTNLAFHRDIVGHIEDGVLHFANPIDQREAELLSRIGLARCILFGDDAMRNDCTFITQFHGIIQKALVSDENNMRELLKWFDKLFTEGIDDRIWKGYKIG